MTPGSLGGRSDERSQPPQPQPDSDDAEAPQKRAEEERQAAEAKAKEEAAAAASAAADSDDAPEDTSGRPPLDEVAQELAENRNVRSLPARGEG